MYDIVLIGAGPAGLTAALYARRAGKSALLLEGSGYGGQITLSPRVENYPGFPQISGGELADRLLSQVLDLGAETDFKTVSALERQGDGSLRVTADDGDAVFGRSVIVAAGVRHRRLGLEHEERLTGAGVSYCAVCDGAFFAGADVAVAGGGNTALQDALLLSSYCRTVHLIHRRETFRGEARLVELLRGRANVIFHTNAVVKALRGGEALSGLLLENTATAAESALNVSGLFVAVGQEPQNDAFRAAVQTDEAGYIVTDEDMATSAAGVFAAGDCRAKRVRQLTTAVADGAVAALSACAYVDGQR